METKQIEKPKTDKKQKILSIIFYVFLIGSILIDIFILLQAYDPCRIDVNRKCALPYRIVGTDIFLVILWIQNILAILVSIIYTTMGIIDKKWKNVLLGMISLILPAIVWTSTLGALDIIWGL